MVSLLTVLSVSVGTAHKIKCIYKCLLNHETKLVNWFIKKWRKLGVCYPGNVVRFLYRVDCNVASHSCSEQEPEGGLLVDCLFISLTCGMCNPDNKLSRRPPWRKRAPPRILAVLAGSFHLEVVLSEDVKKLLAYQLCFSFTVISGWHQNLFSTGSAS